MTLRVGREHEARGYNSVSGLVSFQPSPFSVRRCFRAGSRCTPKMTDHFPNCCCCVGFEVSRQFVIRSGNEQAGIPSCSATGSVGATKLTLNRRWGLGKECW